MGRSLRFVDSWRWLPLDGGSAAGLVAGGRLIHTRNGGVDSLATVVPSMHFEATVMITVLRADQRGMDQIVRYAQGLGAGEGAPTIQLLARSDPALDCGPARRRLVFRLMGKRISPGGAPARGSAPGPDRVVDPSQALDLHLDAVPVPEEHRAGPVQHDPRRGPRRYDVPPLDGHAPADL